MASFTIVLGTFSLPKYSLLLLRGMKLHVLNITFCYEIIIIILILGNNRVYEVELLQWKIE